MIIKQLLPALSPTMEEGTLASWSIKEGDKVESGQVMAEVQTDKAVVEWECLDGGYCRKIVIPEGSEAKVNMVAAIFTSDKDESIDEAVKEAEEENRKLAEAGGGDDGDEDEDDTDAGEPERQAEQASEPESAPAPAAPSSQTPAVASEPQAAPRQPVGKQKVSPVAARIAADQGVPLNELRGTGTGGRIVRRDVEAYLQRGAGTAAAAKAKDENPFLIPAGPAYVDEPMSQMRSIIAKRLGEAKRDIPHFYVTEKIDCEKLIDLRAQLNSHEGVKISFNDLILKATAVALRRHPGVNATFEGKTIRKWSSADISVAVAIPDGLITPIVKGVQRLTLSEIAATVKDLAKRARSGKLAPEEFQGGTFTISNLGMYGIEAFDAIINPPQVGILAIGGIKDEAVVRDGELVAGKTMRLTLSCDHRAVDGALAAEFLRTLRQLLEAPASLML